MATQTDNRQRTTDNGLIDLDPLVLMKRDPALAERAWNRLSRHEQVRALLRVGAPERQILCELAIDTAALVQAIPAQELWLTIQELGKEDAIVLVQHASMAQLQFCLDVEAWQKDKWDPQATKEWLRVIAAAGPETILRFWHEADQELIGLLCKQWITVYKRVSDEDIGLAIPWPREESPVTLDGKLYFQIADEEIDPWFRPMFEVYGRHDLMAIHSLADSMMGVIVSEQVELAYEWRSRRLAEEGMPPFDEAIGVYRRFSDADIEKLPKRHREPSDEVRVQAGFPLVAIENCELLLRDALRTSEDPRLVDECLLELARIANRVVVADGHAFTTETLSRALNKAVAYVNIGLEVVSERNLNAAAELLRHLWLTHLFQIGFSRVMDLGDQARLWLAINPTQRADDLDDPTTDEAIALERIKAASWKWPKCYVGPQSPDGVLHRDFQDISEIQQVSVDLQELADSFSAK